VLADRELFVPAVELYVAAGSLEPTLEILRRRGHELLDESPEALLTGWADAMEATDGPGATGWWSLLEGYRLLRAGRLREAGRRLRTSLEAIEGDEDGRYLAYRELAHRDFLAEETDAAIHHARAALELASDDRRQADCYQLLAFALSWACRWRELDEALAAFTANRGADSARLAAKIAGLEAQSAQLQGDLRRALSIGEDSLDGARTHLPRHNLAGYLTLLASLDCFAGRYEASAHLLDEARGLCEAHDLTRVRVYVEVIGSSLLAQQGRLDDCLAALDDALSAPLAQSDPGLLVEVHLRRGTALRRAGSLAMAAQEYGRALCEMGERDSPYDRLDLQLELAFTEGLTGAEKRAPQRIGRLCDDAGARQLRFQEAKGRFYLGVLAARDGRTGEADLAPALAALLRLGHGDFVGQESVGNPEVAQWMQRAETDDDLLREMLATIALQAGGPALLATLAGRSERIGTLVLETAGGDLPARQAFHLQQALRRHPSRSVRDRARAAIRLAGETGERLCPELTPREEEILAVLAEGSSNKEIAQRLFLAVPTVKTHVHRILTKTGQRGRLAVALMYRQRAATARHAGEAGPAGAGAGTNGDAPR
jgi:DNA-binding CsgD family transcriptional regulator/tetratricopeptide (TPR) repeat protein